MVCVCMGMHLPQFMCGNLKITESVLSLHLYLGFRDDTQVVRLELQVPLQLRQLACHRSAFQNHIRYLRVW